jgi:hypothetical protein
MQNPYPEKTARWWFHEYLPHPWKREAILAAKLYPIYPIGNDGSEMTFETLQSALGSSFKWNESDEDPGTVNERWRHWNMIMSLYAEDYADTTSIPELFIAHRPEQSNRRAELIQLTAGALAKGNVIGPPEKIAEISVQCAEAALDIINKK